MTQSNDIGVPATMLCAAALALAMLSGCSPRDELSEQQERERVLAEYEHQNRRLNDDVLFMDNGKCLNAALAPKPWRRVADRSGVLPPSSFSFTVPLSAIGLSDQVFLNASDEPATPTGDLRVHVGPELEPNSQMWPIAKPLRVRRLLEKKLVGSEIENWSENRDLRLFERDGHSWAIISVDPRTQCKSSFGIISLLKFADCRVNVPELTASAAFRVPTPVRGEIPPMMAAARDLVTALADDCPSP